MRYVCVGEAIYVTVTCYTCYMLLAMLVCFSCHFNVNSCMCLLVFSMGDLCVSCSLLRVTPHHLLCCVSIA